LEQNESLILTVYYPAVKCLMPVAFQVRLEPIHLPNKLKICVVNINHFCHGYTPVNVLMPSTLTQCEVANVRSKSAATSFASVSDCFASKSLTSSAKLLAYLSVSSMLENINEASFSCASAPSIMLIA